MNESSPHAGNLVGSDGCSDATAAQSQATVDLSPCHGMGQGNDEIGIVVVGIEVEGTEVNDGISAALQLFCQCLLQRKSAVIGG